jgi:hypothetical protein
MYLHAYNSVVIARVEAINLSHYTVLGTIVMVVGDYEVASVGAEMSSGSHEKF